MSIDDTLKERGDSYGEFSSQGMYTQALKEIFRDEDSSWDSMEDDMKEALDMIASKIARLLNGDPYHIDSWHDIQGYARLVEARLIKEENHENIDTAIEDMVKDFDRRSGLTASEIANKNFEPSQRSIENSPKKGDRVRVTKGLHTGLGTVIEDSIAPWIAMDEPTGDRYCNDGRDGWVTGHMTCEPLENLELIITPKRILDNAFRNVSSLPDATVTPKFFPDPFPTNPCAEVGMEAAHGGYSETLQTEWPEGKL